MTKYIDQEREKYWPVSRKLKAEYRDGDKPAPIYADGDLIWLKNGLYHRDGDKPARINSDGSLAWYQNDQYHRDGDKPALIFADGSLDWFQNGQRHRLHGPAIIYPGGTLEWFIYDKNITKEVKKWIGRKRWCGTTEQIVEFQLRFG